MYDVQRRKFRTPAQTQSQMPRTLSKRELRREFDEAVNQAASDENVEVVRASLGVEQQVHLREYSLPEVIELGKSLEINIIYAFLEETDDESPEWARVYFFHQGAAHVQYVETEELSQLREDETKEKVNEFERKRELAEELLEQYSDVLSDAQEYRLKHNVEDMRMERLFSLQDTLQEKEEEKEMEDQIDEELEKKLAEELCHDKRFNQSFNETATEMLLRDLDIVFDNENIRISEVHNRAKSLLKVKGE